LATLLTPQKNSGESESFVKQHLALSLFRISQLKKNTAEVKEMICSALGEDALSCGIRSDQKFKSGNLDFENEERLG